MYSTEEITFEQLPKAIAELLDKVNTLTDLVVKKFGSESSREEKEWLDLEELCAYLPDKPSKQTVYGWVCRRYIPYHKKTKKLAFLKSEIDEWVATSRHETADEISESAMNEHGYKKGGLR